MILDQQQQAVVDSAAEKIMVVAGPGSGKSRCLVECIARLIQEGAEPDSILAFSFTRKSANELKERLLDRIGGKAHEITCGTSHSVALDCIRKFNPAKARHSVYGETET